MNPFLGIFVATCLIVTGAIVADHVRAKHHSPTEEHFWTQAQVSIRETTLTDGTPCAILGNVQGSPIAITCGWK